MLTRLMHLLHTTTASTKIADRAGSTHLRLEVCECGSDLGLLRTQLRTDHGVGVAHAGADQIGRYFHQRLASLDPLALVHQRTVDGSGGLCGQGKHARAGLELPRHLGAARVVSEDQEQDYRGGKARCQQSPPRERQWRRKVDYTHPLAALRLQHFTAKQIPHPLFQLPVTSLRAKV